MEEKRTGLTEQERLTLEQQYIALQMLDNAGDMLDNKASVMLGISGLVISVMSVVDALNATPATLLDKVAVVLGLASLIGMIASAVRALAPTEYGTPGPVEWDRIYNGYIHEDLDRCLANIINNVSGVRADLIERNKRKAKPLDWFNVFLIIQLVCLIVVAI